MNRYKSTRAVVYKSVLGAALTAILYIASYDKLVTFSLCNSIIELNVASLTLKGCTLINRTSGFAVGENGAILEYNKGFWRLINSPTMFTLNKVLMVNGTFGFAVGSNGTILRYDGVLWSKIVTPIQRHFYDVSIVHDKLGFAVGDGALYRFDGELWSFQKYIFPSVSHIDMYNETFGVVVGGGISYIYDGKNWSEIWIDPKNEIEMMDVCAINGSMAFSVGFDVCKGLGVVYKFSGYNWSFICGADGVLTSISMIEETKGFITGYESDGKGKIWKFNGLECSNAVHPIIECLWDVKIIDMECGFAVGNNATILKWDGSSWTREIIGEIPGKMTECTLTHIILVSSPVIAVLFIMFRIKKVKRKVGGKM
ncbi:MAG: hypothetical protein FGF50_01625 [Candidatus Brockarchaeota archaeon]|nr:hypothetical protein [Candidatus Brockarchaeota archaeon]